MPAHHPAMRARRATLFAVAAVLIACASWYVWRQCALAPAQPWMGYASVAGEEIQPFDCTAELADALANLPPPGHLRLPAAPEGFEWRDVVPGEKICVDVLRWGSWQPHADLRQQAALDYVRGPRVDAALAELRRLRGRPFRVRPDTAQLLRPGQPVPSIDVGSAAEICIARARSYAAGSSDLAGALDELRTAAWLAADCPLVQWGARPGPEIQELLTEEITYMAHEHELPPEIVNELIDLVATLPDRGNEWPNLLDRLLGDLGRVVESSFSCDEAGNGRYLLCNQVPRPNRRIRPRPVLWNVLAPLYWDRRSALDRIRQLRAQLSDLDRASFQAARARLGTVDLLLGSARRWDAPALYEHSGSIILPRVAQVLFDVALTRADQRACLIVLALERFAAAHGHLPEELDELAAEFLPDVPIDPFATSAPFRYCRIASEGYVLYSVGQDGIDHGGHVSDRPMHADDDIIYSKPRQCEVPLPQLAPIGALEFEEE